MNLNQQAIIITGGAKGIGAAIAAACIEHGAQVLLCDLDAQALQSRCEQLGPQAHGLTIDLTDNQAAEKVLQAAIEQMGSVTGLVNNAGIFPRTALEDVNSEHFDAIFTINTKLPLLLSQQVSLHMMKQKQSGSIVNIGSINAYCGQTDLLIYSMSKGALMTMTRNLADTLAPHHIRVNQLNVGWTATETELALKAKEGLPDNWHHSVPKTYAPQGHVMKPEQIAPHVAFWLSPHSAPVTGAVYEVEQYPFMGRNRLNELTL